MKENYNSSIDIEELKGRLLDIKEVKNIITTDKYEDSPYYLCFLLRFIREELLYDNIALKSKYYNKAFTIKSMQAFWLMAEDNREEVLKEKVEFLDRLIIKYTKQIEEYENTGIPET